MKGLKVTLLVFAFFSFLLVGCNSVPKDDPFKFAEGEVVYYTIDNVPMLVQKQIFKKGKKQYRVVFKNEEGFLQYNTVGEDEILSTPTDQSSEQ